MWFSFFLSRDRGHRQERAYARGVVSCCTDQRVWGWVRGGRRGHVTTSTYPTRGAGVTFAIACGRLCLFTLSSKVT